MSESKKCAHGYSTVPWDCEIAITNRGGVPFVALRSDGKEFLIPLQAWDTVVDQIDDMLKEFVVVAGPPYSGPPQ